MAGKSGRNSMRMEWDWVCCDVCSRWEVFENCKRELGLEKFDAEKIGKIWLMCRLCVQEIRLEKAERLELVVRGLEDRVEVLSGRFDELVGCKLQEMMQEEDQKVAVVGLVEDLETRIGEVASKIVVGEMRLEKELRKVESMAGDSLSKVTAVEIRMAELAQEWPTPEESRMVKVRKESVPCFREKESFRDRVKKMPRESVLLVGDSMARGMGHCLMRDGGGYSGISKSIAYGGARIEDLEGRIQCLGDKPDSHLVLVVGTNNLCQEGSEVIRRRLERLIEELRKHRYRKVSFVGILRRRVNGYLDSRRIGINMRLQRMCEENGFEFVEGDVGVEHLARDGLHLNGEGEDYMARLVFSHCRQFLN
jgi:hypothetical protein